MYTTLVSTFKEWCVIIAWLSTAIEHKDVSKGSTYKMM